MPPPELPLLEFQDATSFEGWLADQPERAAGAWVKFEKREGRGRSLSKSDAVDSALAHGWIDGLLISVRN